jgi:hypothetical protein
VPATQLSDKVLRYLKRVIGFSMVNLGISEPTLGRPAGSRGKYFYDAADI